MTKRQAVGGTMSARGGRNARKLGLLKLLTFSRWKQLMTTDRYRWQKVWHLMLKDFPLRHHFDNQRKWANITQFNLNRGGGRRKKEGKKNEKTVLLACWATGDLTVKYNTINTKKDDDNRAKLVHESSPGLDNELVGGNGQNSFFTWMLSSALWVQCIMVVKVSVVMRPPRKCWTLMLRTAIPEKAHTRK